MNKTLGMVVLMIVAAGVVVCIYIVPRVRVSGFAESTSAAADSACLACQRAIKAAVGLYRSKEGSSPESLIDLVNAKYLPEMPSCPEGGTYAVDGTCSIDHTD